MCYNDCIALVRKYTTEASVMIIMSTILSLPTAPQFTNPERQAWRELGKAVYESTELPKVAQEVERHVLPGWSKEYGGLVLILYKAGTEKRIEYRWEF